MRGVRFNRPVDMGRIRWQRRGVHLHSPNETRSHCRVCGKWIEVGATIWRKDWDDTYAHEACGFERPKVTKFAAIAGYVRWDGQRITLECDIGFLTQKAAQERADELATKHAQANQVEGREVIGFTSEYQAEKLPIEEP